MTNETLEMFSIEKNVKHYSDLLRNQLIYKYALESSNIGAWDWDIVKNKVYHSKESKLLFGYSNAEIDLSETDWTEHIHPEDLEGLQKNVKDHLEGKVKEYRSQHRILRKDGSYKWVLDCGKVIAHDDSGQPTRFIGTTIDISKDKESEDCLKQNLNVITNQNKKLTNFAHIVTHNLKEYAGNFESLLNFYDQAENHEEKSELIDHLKTVSTSLTDTIKNLSEIVSQQLKRKIECERLNIYEYINKTFNLLDLEVANKKATINNNVHKELYIYSNPAYLESIILNLATNALKYAHPDRYPVIDINSTLNKDELIIKVKDNGIGIDLEKHGNNIFGLYNTFHGNDNAEGIGLYITKNQIEALGGKITVESEFGLGTTFYITIKEHK